MNYYQILEVDRTASAQEIKNAYRKQAKRYHPDLNQNNPQAEQSFREVTKAYKVLADETARKAYDKERNSRSPLPPEKKKAAAKRTGFNPMDVSDMFADYMKMK